MKKNYCSKCGRKLLKGKEKGRTVQFCPVHINDMNPVSAKAEIVKKFKSYKGSGW